MDALAKDRDMSKAETRRLLDTVTDTFKATLAEGKSYTIPDLGTFSAKTRDERKSYNPHYQQYMKLPPKRVVDYNPNQSLKEDLKHLESDDE